MKAMPKDDLILLLQSEKGNMVNIGNMQQLFDEYGDDYVWDYELTVWKETKSNAYRKAKVFVLRREMEDALPSVQPERDTPKRVSWTGWKGHRYTRYNCPNCKKPVRNDDVYCHRCGQRLMFPKVSHTPYIEGQKQEVIVRWDDE